MTEVGGTVRELQKAVQQARVPESARACLKVWAEAGLTDVPTAVWFPRRIYPQAANLDHVFNVVESGEVDAILFADERRHSPKHNIRDLMGQLQAPIVDLSGRAAQFGDVRFDLNMPETWAEAAKCILEFRRRRRELRDPYAKSIEPELQLMAHAYVSGRSVTAIRYPQIKDAICYPGFWAPEATVPAAEKLVRRGYMKKTFFDRLHECRTCASRRMNVREECPSCRSAELTQEELIHHYHCATLLPESEFRQGTTLVCPKCRQLLRNYGKDYDKPGQVMICGACAKSTSEPEVGFVCMDCSTKCAGDEAHLVDVHSYALTDSAVAALTSPTAGRSSSDDDAHPVAVVEITYGAKPEIVNEHGEAIFERLRRLFIENMTNYLAERGEYRAGLSSDYFLVFDFDEEFAKRMDELLARSSSVLSTQIEPKMSVAMRPARASRERR
jgi:hypothetical protein